IANSFWLTLLVFSLSVEAAIMIGRSGFGIDQAPASRYATFSILTVVGVYGLASSLLIQTRNWLNVMVYTMLAGLILISAATEAKEGFYLGKLWRSVKEASALALATCESPPLEVVPLHPDITLL